MDAEKVKRESEKYILSLGGKVCDWLPVLDPSELNVRSVQDVSERALIQNILVNISFGAPISVAMKWIHANGLSHVLLDKEREILESRVEPDQNIKNMLRWQIECLWVSAWSLSFHTSLVPEQGISDSLASWFPNLRGNEDSSRFLKAARLQSVEELLKKLDLFYRCHWWMRECELTGQNPEPLNLGVIIQRRHMLEWIGNDEHDWDSVDLST